jgi:hypothetical protein
MTTATQNPLVEKYRRMVDIMENSTPEESYEFVKENPKSDLREFHEVVISKDAYLSYLYAENLVKSPWEPGEDAISKDAECSHYYARDVIKGRWEKGEDAMSKEAEFSYLYARDVIKDRWEPGEDAISKDKETLARYAFDVLKGRLPEHLEQIILSDED